MRPGDEELIRRAKAWRKLGGKDLSDCREFHDAIPEKRWHGENGKPPKLQSTWRPLILLLMKFLDQAADKESLRAYQRDHWGTLQGETCVIELSGFPAQSLNEPRDRELFLRERINIIRQRMQDHRPELVIMCATSRKESWEKIAGQAFPNENILENGGTIMAVTRHPVSRGLSNADWEKLGIKLRRLTKLA